MVVQSTAKNVLLVLGTIGALISFGQFVNGCAKSDVKSIFQGLISCIFYIFLLVAVVKQWTLPLTICRILTIIGAVLLAIILVLILIAFGDLSQVEKKDEETVIVVLVVATVVTSIELVVTCFMAYFIRVYLNEIYQDGY